MRIANLDSRLVIVTDHGALDVDRASDGRFGPDPQSAFETWDDFRRWAGGVSHAAAEAYDPALLGPPVPRPRQVFAIGLNYGDHTQESGIQPPAEPPVFTKFPASITGPFAEVSLPTETVDWEAEVVAVLGRLAEHVRAEDAWEHIAGVTVGQDLSERTLQLTGPVPQFSLGKSFTSFAPIGPFVVTPDELPDRDDLEVGCRVNGEQMQKGRTGNLIFSIPLLVERLSSVLPLLPGDLIFTGTPGGVGGARTPPVFLQAGDELVTWVEGVGEIRQTFATGAPHLTMTS